MSLPWIMMCLYLRLFDTVAPLGMQNDDTTLMKETLVLAHYGMVLEKHGSVIGNIENIVHLLNNLHVLKSYSFIIRNAMIS